MTRPNRQLMASPPGPTYIGGYGGPMERQYRAQTDLFLAPSLLPFQFPSLEHLDERVARALQDVRTIEGMATHTCSWLRFSYRAFRAFLRTSDAVGDFLGGDLRRQVRLLECWIGALRERDLGRATINNYWRGLRMLCARISRSDSVVNPLQFVRTPGPGQSRLQCLTQDAAETVLRFVQNDASVPADLRARNAAIVGVMLLAGLRRGELLRLRISNLDLNARVVRVVGGKGRDGGKHRTVPMTEQLRALLAGHLKFRQQVASGAPEVFLGSRYHRALNDCVIRRIFTHIQRHTTIHVSPHMLRHTFCTLLSKMGVPDRLAKEAMGHADYRMLQRYQHVYEGEVAEAMQSRLHLNIDTTDAQVDGRGRSVA